MKKIIEKWKSIDEEMKSTRQKLMPGYIDKRFFQIAFGLIGLILLLNVFLSMSSGQLVNIECNSLQGCDNPFYVCSENDLLINSKAFSIEQKVPCLTEPMWYLTNTSITSIQHFPQGFKYGRTDFFAKYSEHTMWVLLILAFIINAVYYRIKFKTWKYNKENHNGSEQINMPNHNERTRENNQGSKRRGDERPTNTILYEGDKKE